MQPGLRPMPSASATLWCSPAAASACGPTSKSAERVETEAIAAVGTANFAQAGTELEAYRAEHETYAGAVLPPSFGVALVRADATTYCLQAGVGGAVQHFVGPAGPAAAGPC